MTAWRLLLLVVAACFTLDAADPPRPGALVFDPNECLDTARLERPTTEPVVDVSLDAAMPARAEQGVPDDSPSSVAPRQAREWLARLHRAHAHVARRLPPPEDPH